MSLAAALISFAGCQKNEFNGVENTVDGAKTFELVADIAQTKTTLDGYSVEWEEGDVIYMVTAENETGWGKEYESNEKTNVETIAEFEYSDGLFTTEAVLAAGNYTFNAIYTRANQKTWHRAAGSSHSLLSEQSQDCSNPTAHIKENDALVGTFTAAYPLNEPAKVTMSHLYTMMQVNVKNNTGNEITVKNFSVTMDGADIAGVFNVDFATSTVTKKSGASSMIEVAVENGNVANDSSLPVYFVMAPLNNYSGNVTFKVTDAEGNSYSKTVEVTGKSFEAGKYNTTSYTISEADGGSATFDFTKNEWELPVSTQSSQNAGKIIGVIESGKVEMSVPTHGSNPTRLWSASNKIDLRAYSGSSLSFKVPNGYVITGLTFAGSDVSGIDPKSGTYSNKTWSGIANPVEFDITATIKVETIVVEYEKGELPPVTLVSISVNNPVTAYFVGDSFVEPEVVARYSDGSTAAVSEAQFAGFDMEVTGTYNVVVTYEGKEVTYSITVSPKSVGLGTHFEKVTSAPADWSGNYLIVYEGGAVAFNGGLTTLDAASNTVSVTISDNKIEATDAMKNASFTINASGHIQSASGYYIGQTTDANGLKANKTTPYTNTLSLNNDKSVNIMSGGAYLRYNNDAGQKRFRYYKSSSYANQKSITLYKLN